MSSYQQSQFEDANYYEDAITKKDWNETELTAEDISESVYEGDLTADDKFKSQIENKVIQTSNSNKSKGSPTKKITQGRLEHSIDFALLSTFFAFKWRISKIAAVEVL